MSFLENILHEKIRIVYLMLNKHIFMKLKTIILISASLTLTSQTYAQAWITDTLDMGSGQVNDVYYGIETGTRTVVSNTNWDIAFSAINMQGNHHYGSGIWVNEASTNPASQIILYHAINLGAFDTATATSLSGILGSQMHNSTTTYAEGAFNYGAPPIPTNVGWGLDAGPPSYVVTGNKPFIAIKNNIPYKIWIHKQYKLTPYAYEMLIGRLDGLTPIDTVVIDIGVNFPNRLFAYYNITSKQEIDREPHVFEWDINLTRYAKQVSGNNYVSTVGVMSNPYASIAAVHDVVADTVLYSHYHSLFETPAAKIITAIGEEWKKNPSSSGSYYDLDTVTYFIRSWNHSIHQIEFLYADYGNLGRTVLRKRTVQATRIDDVATPLSQWSLVPNPAGNEVTVVLDAKEQAAARILISDISGRIVKQYPVEIRQDMNAFRINTASMPSGLYMVTITNGKWKQTEKLIVSH